MSLEEVLTMAVKLIRTNNLKDEEDSKQIIELILSKLGWDIHNKNDVEKEYVTKRNTEKQGKNPSVDYALKSSYQAPEVFIEAKKIGKADEKAEEQLFESAANEKVLFLVLTDGETWTFYAGDKIGRRKDTYTDRLLNRMKLESNEKEKIKEYASSLSAYLRKDRIVTKKTAENNAKKQYNKNISIKEARETIPVVWQKLVENSNATLCNLLVKEVKSLCGTKPEPDDLEVFLQSLQMPDALLNSSLPSSKKSAPRQQSAESDSARPQPTRKEQPKIGRFVLDVNGKRFETGTAIGTLAAILKEFSGRDPDFMERLAEKTVGRKRRLVARKRNDLYDNPKFLEKSSLSLGNGWWLGHHLSTKDIQKKIEIACEVAGVKFGAQLKLIER